MLLLGVIYLGISRIAKHPVCGTPHNQVQHCAFGNHISGAVSLPAGIGNPDSAIS